MRIIQLKDGIGHPIANYNDGDIFISNDFSIMKYYTEPFKSSFAVLILCVKGSGVITIDEKRHKISSKQILLLTPNTIVSGVESKTNTVFRALAFDFNIFKNNIVFNKDMWTDLFSVRSHPVRKLSDYQYKIMNHYFELAYLYTENTNDVYQKEKMSHLICCWIYDLLTIISEYTDYKQKKTEIFSTNDIIFQRFMEILSVNKGKIRSVEQISKKMCISPKYLSVQIKKTSGKTPQNLIHECTIGAIKEQLKYSGKSVKEISNDMDFTEPSFFGKFFKQHTGMTPLEYRKQVLKTKI